MLWWLVTVTAVTAVTILLLSVIFVTKLVATEERNSAWIPRIVSIVSICVAFYTVLLLPLDVSATSEDPTTHDVPVHLLWRVAFATYYALLVTVIPFTMVYYDSWRPDQPGVCTQLRPGLLTAFLSTVIVTACLAAIWLAVGYVDDPANQTSSLTAASAPDAPSSLTVRDTGHKHLIALDIFALAVASVLGWGVLIIFGATGLVAVPLRGVLAFLHRPQPISTAQFETERLRIHTATERLLERGRRLEQESGPSPNLRTRRKMLAFRRDAKQLHDEYEQLESGYHLSGGSVIRSYIGFVVSLFCGVTSVGWVLHVVLYKIAHVHPFMNNVLLSLQVFFPMAATLVYAWLAGYLMLCTVVGCWAIGEGLVLFPVFALQMNKTMLNALLFNCILLLVASLAVLQLCVSAFDQYDADTIILSLFAKTEELFGVQRVFNCAPIPFLATGLLALVWLLACPHLCTANHDDDDDY